MESTQLLAVIEVPHDNRVRCSAAGCGHSVYKRVHIIRRGGCLRVYGSTCFAREFHGHEVAKSSPRFTATAGRLLNAEERQLLLTNTERLIEMFEAECAVEQEQLKTLPVPLASRNDKWLARAPLPRVKSRLPHFTQEESAFAEVEARRILNARFAGLDFDSPGFRGLLLMEIDRILREKMG